MEYRSSVSNLDQDQLQVKASVARHLLYSRRVVQS